MDVFQRDLWGCVGREPGRKGQRGVCSPTGLSVRSPPCPDSAPGEGGEGPSLPGTFRGGRGGARRAPGRTPEVSPLSPGAEAAVSLRLCHFLCDRSSAGSSCQLTDLRAVVPTGELFWGGSAHGAAGREGVMPPGKALCCPGESRVIKHF